MGKEEALFNGFALQEEYLGNEKPINKVNPLVSVRVATYQHAPFIANCLDSILSQKTDFPFEIVVGEDESSDGTREICKKYAEKYPDKIRLFLRDRNLSQYYENGKVVARFNSRWNTMSCRGKYIAICEGDDYWAYEKKLQKQADFLENNPNFSFCCGGYIAKNTITGETKTVIRSKSGNEDEHGFAFGLKDVKSKWLTKTLTTLYRKAAIDIELFNRYNFSRDIHFFYHLLVLGKGYYFKQVFGIYNVHPGGMNSMQQGKVNANAAYNSYKELYEFNRDEFTREKAIKSTINLLNYNLYNKYPDNTLEKRLRLFKEAVLLTRNIKDFKSLLNAFVKREVKDRLKNSASE